MKRISLTFGAFILGALCSHSALADTFSFSFIGAAYSGSGTFTTTPGVSVPFGLTEFNITSISGTVTPTFGVVSPITGPSTFDGADNELFELGTSGVYYLDNKGVSFTLKNGNTVNLSTGGFTYYADSAILLFTSESIAVTYPPDPRRFLSRAALHCLGRVF